MKIIVNLAGISIEIRWTCYRNSFETPLKLYGNHTDVLSTFCGRCDGDHIEILWKPYRHSMRNLWKSYRSCMESCRNSRNTLSKIYGNQIEALSKICWNSMELKSKFHRNSIEILWNSYRFSIVIPLKCYGICIEILSNGNQIETPWKFNGIFMETTPKRSRKIYWNSMEII